MWFSAFFLLFALKKIRSVLFFILFLIYFLFFRFLFLRQVILRKDTFFKSRSHRNSQTPSASMTTQDTCEFNKMMMNMPPEQDTPTQMYSVILRTSVLMQEYMSGDGHDKGLAWCVFGRKEQSSSGRSIEGARGTDGNQEETARCGWKTGGRQRGRQEQ
jgi:hypothetical protein